MSQDDLLRKLGQVAREEAEGDSWDERWDRLAAGTLSAEEETELRRLADMSEDGRLAYEAFRPLGEEFQARVLQAIAPRPAPVPVPKVEPIPGPWWPRLPRWSAATAIAATLATMMWRVVPMWLVGPLPHYSVAAISGGTSVTRGDVVEARELAPGDRFQATLQPVTAVRRASSLRAEACLVRDGEARPVELATERDDSGALRVTGTLDPRLPTGTWTLWLVVGRRGALPDLADVQRFSTAGPIGDRNWKALPKTLHIQPRAPD